MQKKIIKRKSRPKHVVWKAARDVIGLN